MVGTVNRSALTGTYDERLRDDLRKRSSDSTDPGNLHELPGSVVSDASADFTRGGKVERTPTFVPRALPYPSLTPRLPWLPPYNGKPHLPALLRSVSLVNAGYATLVTCKLSDDCSF
jgi:hypothetical protein